MRVLYRLTTVLLLFWPAVHGQETTGSITGVVKDPTGAVVAGANLTLTNMDTAAEYRAVSEESGNYLFPWYAPADTGWGWKLRGSSAYSRTA